MMGQQSGLQEQLFYEFRLDDWVPVDHLLEKATLSSIWVVCAARWHRFTAIPGDRQSIPN